MEVVQLTCQLPRHEHAPDIICRKYNELVGNVWLETEISPLGY